MQYKRSEIFCSNQGGKRELIKHLEKKQFFSLLPPGPNITHWIILDKNEDFEPLFSLKSENIQTGW